MLETVQFLVETDPLFIAFGALLLDIPRYTLSLLSLGVAVVTRVFRMAPVRVHSVMVSVIVPTFNGGKGLAPTIASLRRQSHRAIEIIVVDDGSTDGTRATAMRARAQGLVDMVICHGTRCGRSAAINAAARFANGELLFTVDADTILDQDALTRLIDAFYDRRVAGASSNIGIANEVASVWTRLQRLEYLMSIGAGRTVLDILGAVACLSGACSMYRRDVFLRQGGLDVGPGEDLEFTLRLRRLGYTVRFVADAWAETDGPVRGLNLLRQRARWDRDALRVRSISYGEFRFFHRRERLRDTLQRLDFIVFDLFPTIGFPLYLVYLFAVFGPAAVPLLVAIYIALLWIGLLNLALAFAMFGRSCDLVTLCLAPVLPLYQGVYLKCARVLSYSAEILFAASCRDDFVPPRVRRALFGDPARGTAA
jgi:cellulose synthase/poly-beta-1,6-N-acetylglucosamine synthase-like glycosyltransferase